MTNSRARVGAGQLIVGEIVLVGLVAAYGGPGWFFLGLLTAAAGILVATFGRVDGRWWYQAALGYRRFARRRGQVAAELVAATVAAVPADPGLVWLRTLAPDLRVRPVIGADPGAGEIVVGVASDEHGWFGAIAVPAGPTLPPLAELAEVVDGPVPISSAQLVLRPGGRLAWLAVRLSAVDAAALARTHGLSAVDTVICSAVQRAARIMRDLGHQAAVLDPIGLLAALAEANELDGPPQEYWTHWRSGRLAHTVYLARDWPDRLVTAAPGARVSIALAARGDWSALVRVTARPGRHGAACRALTRAAAAVGVRLRRLDGDHAPAAYACAPTGRTAQALAGPVAVGRFRGEFSSSLGSQPPRPVFDEII